jgi:hypothetical protein
MDVKRILILVIFAFILYGCQAPRAIPTTPSPSELKLTETIEPTTKPTWTQVQEGANNGEVFSIYLVADPQISSSDLDDWSLDALPLAEPPLISIEDILVYDWENQAFDVTEESNRRLFEVVGGSVPVNGRPFVVVAKDERIYVGAFWTLASSLSIDGVVIEEPVFKDDATIKLVLGYPTEVFFTGEDPRGDARILEALTEKGLLQ